MFSIRTNAVIAFSLAFLIALLSLPMTPSAQTHLPWMQVPGGATDISVGANGVVWVVGTDTAPWRSNGKKWVKYPGSLLVRIAVDPKGNPWGVNKRREIWRYSGRTWRRLPGLATDISIGKNGAVWIVGTDTAPYRWNGKGWTKHAGSLLTRIAVDPNGNPWGVNKRQEIWRYSGRTWRRMPGRATGVSIGANGAVWIVGTDYAPYRWTNGKWQKHLGGITGIATGPNGYIWAINGENGIFVDRRGAKNAPKPIVSNVPKLPPTVPASVASSTLQQYPKFKNVKVGWKRNGNTLIGTARIGNATAKAIAFKLPGNTPAIAALIVPKMTIAQLLPLRGPNPLGSYSVNNVVIFTVPAARNSIRHRISALPAVIANALKANDDAFGEAGATIDLAPGMTYFGKLDKPKGLVKTAFDRMKIRNIGVAGSIAFTEYSRPVNTVTLTARLRKDPLTDILGPIRVITVAKSAEPNLFVTATGTTDFEVGYSSTFKIFDQVLDGTLAFSKSGAGAAAETAVSVELSKQGPWKNPRLSGARLKNVTLNDAVITLSRALGAGASGTSLSVVTASTKIHSTTYKPAAFTFTLEGASALPKAAFVDLATTQVSLTEMAELMEISLQLTPQGQIAQRGPIRPGKVVTTLGLDKLPSSLITFKNPKIYLATPGAVEPDPPPAPPLPAIAGAGVHVRGSVVAFGKQFARTATRIDSDGLHINTKIGTLPFGGFQLRDARFKLDAAPKIRPVASFSGRTQIGPVPIASTTIDIGRTNFGFNIKTACIALAKIEASGRTRGFRYSIPKPSIKPCDGGAAAAIIAAAEASGRAAVTAGNAVAHTASDVANKTTAVVGGPAATAAYNAALKGYNAALDAWNNLSSFFKGKKSKPSKPRKPRPLDCRKTGQVTWEGRCQFNLAANFSAGAGASQSSDYQSQNSAGRLIDGTLNNALAATKYGANPWMQLSLGRNRAWVDRIVVVNRADKYANQLKGAIVAVSAKYSGKDLMTKKDPEIYRIRLMNPDLATTIRPGKWGEGKWAKNVMIYHPSTAQKPKATLALQEVIVLGNECKCANYWRRVPYAAVDIAGGPRKIWHINITGHLYSSAAPLKQMPTAKRPWKKITPNPDPNGVMHRVTVDPWGNPWVALTGGQIYRYNKGKWFRVPGDARDVAAAGKFMMMASGFDDMAVNQKSYGAPDAIQSWQATGSHGASIAAASNNISWLVKRSGDIWQRPMGKKWRKVPGKAIDIATNGKTTFIIARNGAPYKHRPGNAKWLRMHGEKNRRIALDRTGRPWMVGGNGDIWTWHDYK